MARVIKTKFKNFDKFSEWCMYSRFSYDRDRNPVIACTNEQNHPEGCSWGKCEQEKCPMFKEKGR